ncbi:MAG: YitT family protein [Bacteroidales bacterium]|nr:YitT family protein [Bacteroidales bacterium]
MKRKPVVDYILIIVGALLQAVAYVLFIAPHNIVPGGVYGITIILHHLTHGLFSFAPDGLPMGVMALFFNVPLLLLATRKLGLRSGARTIVAFVAIAAFTDIIEAITGGKPLIENDVLLSAVFGGIVLGVGVFLVINSYGTCAGTDVLARVISRAWGINLSTMILVIDSIIVILGFFAFKSPLVPLYSLITILAYSATIERLHVTNPNCMLTIVTEKIDDVKQFILYETGHGGSYVDAKGLYTDNDKKLILAVVSRREATACETRIRKIDPAAFVVVTDAHDVNGNGFFSVPHWDYRKENESAPLQ